MFMLYKGLEIQEKQCRHCKSHLFSTSFLFVSMWVKKKMGRHCFILPIALFEIFERTFELLNAFVKLSATYRVALFFKHSIMLYLICELDQ